MISCGWLTNVITERCEVLTVCHLWWQQVSKFTPRLPFFRFASHPAPVKCVTYKYNVQSGCERWTHWLICPSDILTRSFFSYTSPGKIEWYEKKKMNKQAISRRYEWRERLVSDEENRGHGKETSVIQVQPKYAGNTSVQRCSRKKVMWDAPLVHYWRVRTSTSGSEEMKLRWPCDHHDYTTRKKILCQNVIADRSLTSSFFTDMLKFD